MKEIEYLFMFCSRVSLFPIIEQMEYLTGIFNRTRIYVLAVAEYCYLLEHPLHFNLAYMSDTI